MKILLVTASEPSPDKGGGGTITRWFADMLQAAPIGAELDLIWMVDDIGRHKTWRRVSRALRSLLTGRPSRAEYFHSAVGLRRIEQALRGTPHDVAIIDFAELAFVRDHLPANLPVVLRCHNVEHQLFRQRFERRPWLSRLLGFEFERLRRYEQDGARRIGNLICLSQRDADHFAALSADMNILVMPPVFEAGVPPRPRTTIRSGGALVLGFLGNCNWWPNRQGVTWFLETVLPRLHVPVRVELFGMGSDALPATDPRVTGHGFVADLAPLWRDCDIVICPIFEGSGVNVKLAEAVFHRRPVIATSFACDGLALGEGPGLRIADTAEAWIDILNSPAARLLAGTEIPVETAARFSQAFQTRRLLQFLENAVSPHRAGEALSTRMPAWQESR